MTRPPYEAVIFDLDGVVTRTALVHSAAWKRMFDGYLRERADRLGETFQPFTHEDDYLPHVDGRPRYDGVAAFLESRGIELDRGRPEDPPELETVCGVGNRKNAAFAEIVEREGVQVYGSTVAWIDRLVEAGIRVGVASSSKNARPVLAAAGLLDRMETVVDGVVSAERGLAGKPAPDIFVEAARELGASPDRSVVVEDAVSGVAAGAAGGFGLVVGVAREDNSEALLAAGADLVVPDLAEITEDAVRAWFARGLAEDGWILRYRGFEPDRERHREALLTVGNGYLGTRGSAAECRAGECHYPATYIAGVYDRATSRVGDREVENEDLVNAVDWLPLGLQIDDQAPFLPDDACDLERILDLRTGVLTRRATTRDGAGGVVDLESHRFASMDDPHRVAQSARITPDRPCRVRVEVGLDGDLINDGVARYRSLECRHLEPLDAVAEGPRLALVSRTRESGIVVAAAARIEVSVDGERVTPAWDPQVGPGTARTRFEVNLADGQILRVDKRVGIHTSRETSDPLTAAEATVEGSRGFDADAAASAARWADLWDRMDVQVEGDRRAQKLLRLHLAHLAVSYSRHSAPLDVGITARGLHGEAYRGHVFWDELFIQPLFALHDPAVSRAMLRYRHRRLGAARRAARDAGHRGAMFPWQSGSDGREETQTTHLNPLSGSWDPDHSHRQRHVSLAVAFDVWQHVRITGDQGFLAGDGGELLVAIARFWESLAEDDGDGHLHIRGVMGPDEFHEALPGASRGGLDDNAYTNLMVAWLMRAVPVALEGLDPEERGALEQRTSLSPDELVRWATVGSRIHVPLSDDGILEQFAGYFELEELDWDHYRREHGDIHRMDRILKAEGRSPDAFKVAKQADALMIFYNLPIPDVTALVGDLGHTPPPDWVERNLAYYLPRTSHGSTLSRVVHALLATRIGDRALGWELYREALVSDHDDIQGGTTAEGIHTGVMAGTVWITLRAFAGLSLGGETLSLSPRLPRGWRKLAFGLGFRGDRYRVEIRPGGVAIRARDARHGTVEVDGRAHPLGADRWIEIPCGEE